MNPDLRHVLRSRAVYYENTCPQRTMSGRFLALCALGLAGSLFVGYCVYFDSKRRSDPDYKKKVLAREFEHVTVQCAHWSCIIYIPCSVVCVCMNV